MDRRVISPFFHSSLRKFFRCARVTSAVTSKRPATGISFSISSMIRFHNSKQW